MWKIAKVENCFKKIAETDLGQIVLIRVEDLLTLD